MHATASVESGADGTTGIHTGEEHDLSVLKRMLLGAVTAMVVVAVLAVGSASATTPPPVLPTGTVPTMGYATQDANVPYLAWRGEHVRLVGCDEFSFPGGSTATWLLEDPPNDPVFQPALDFNSNKVGQCAQAVWVSQKAGVAFIKLIVRDEGGNDIFEKQFIVGWMQFGKVTAVGGGDVNAGDFCNSRRSTRSRQSSSGCSGRTRTAGTIRSTRGTASNHRQGHPSPRERFQRVGPRSVVDAARRLGQAGLP